MAWTTPRTWATNDIVTAAQLNTHVRDNENFLRGFHGARLWESAALSQTANNAWQLVTWDSEDYDTDAIGDPANNKHTVPTGFGGYWRITAQVAYSGNATGGFRQGRIVKNETYSTRTPNAVGTILMVGQAQSNNASAQYNLITWTGLLAVGDYVTIEALQNSGGSLAFGVGKETLWFESHYLGS